MLPLRVVLDTNIVVSAALKPDGLQRTVFLFAVTKPARLYVTSVILAEYREVLARPELGIRKGVQQQFLQIIKARAHLTFPSRQLDVANDPDDNIFLECADAAKADYLVTGNLRHFPTYWTKTKVVSTKDFITMVAPHLG